MKKLVGFASNLIIIPGYLLNIIIILKWKYPHLPKGSKNLKNMIKSMMFAVQAVFKGYLAMPSSKLTNRDMLDIIYKLFIYSDNLSTSFCEILILLSPHNN